MVAPESLDAARLPPSGLTGLDLNWSRLETVEIDGTPRTFHFLDTQTVAEEEFELTLLCVHGNPSWSYLWRDLLANLPPGVRGIAVDHLDMGFSDRTGTYRRLAQRIDDLTALTDHLEITGPVVTVAHDWGGPISLGWALRHLKQLAGVVLTNTAVHQPEDAAAPRIIRAVRSKSALRRTTVDTTGFITGALEMSKPRISKDVRAGFLAPYETKERREAIQHFVEDIPLEPDHPTAETLDAIANGLEHLADTPSLLLWGAKDPVFSDLYLHDLEARLPHADVHRWPAAGHFVTEDAPAAEAIADWVGALKHQNENVTSSTEPTRLLERVSDRERADKVAIAEMTNDQDAITFGDLAARIEATASGLADHGVNPGDRVAIMVPPGIELVAITYGCWRLGAIAVLVDGALTPPQMTAALKSANPKYLIGIERALAASRALRWPGERIALAPLTGAQARVFSVGGDLQTLRDATTVDPSRPLPVDTDEAAVIFTSGSTGPSKGVRYTHGQIAAQRNIISDLYSITSDDSLVAAFAPFALYGPMLGITSVVPDMDVSAPASITSTTLAEAVAAIDATLVFASPAALASVIATKSNISRKHFEALAKVRLLLSAGAPIRTELFDQAQTIFPYALPYTPYGMTEVLPVSTISLPEIHEAGTGNGVCVGTPVPGVDVMIRPIDDVTAPSGRANFGEIVVRAPHARLAYDRLWHTTFVASQPPGWHSTGDVGYVDDDGRLWMGGRVVDVIQTTRGAIAPVQLEQAIEALSDVAMAAVVGIGPSDNQQIVAVVQLDTPPKKSGLADLDLIDRVRRVATETIGTDVVAVLSVPAMPVDRRHNSKIDRGQLRSWSAGVLEGKPLGMNKPPPVNTERLASSEAPMSDSSNDRTSPWFVSEPVADQPGTAAMPVPGSTPSKGSLLDRAFNGPDPSSEPRAALKVLVTGSTSMIGNAVVDRLVSRGDEVTVIQRSPSGRSDVTELQGSITDIDAVTRAVSGQDAVIHLAAKVDIVGELDEFVRVNVEGTTNMISAAREAGVSRFVHISSPSVAHGGESISGAGAEPADPDRTSGHYATTKAMAEQLALAASSDDMPIVAIRPHLVIGPGDTQLVERILDRARSGRMPLIGTGLALVDVTWIDNAADAMVAALDQSPNLGSRAYVISNGEPRTIHELIARITKAANVEWSPRSVPRKVAILGGSLAEKIWARTGRDDEPPMTAFGAEQLSTAHWFNQRATRRALQWEPTISLDEGFAQLDEHYA